jgi:plasmid maintenance system antidote protein VapI
MTEEFEIYKGIHPGKVIERLLTKRNIAQRHFMRSLPARTQTFNAIIKAERPLNLPLSLKIERALDLEEGSLMTLQVHYDIKLERLRTQGPGPNIPPVIFGDVDMAKIDWQKYAEFVIKRVYERGDQNERDEIDGFYGSEKVNKVLEGLPRLPSGALVLMPDLQKRFFEKHGLSTTTNNSGT